MSAAGSSWGDGMAKSQGVVGDRHDVDKRVRKRWIRSVGGVAAPLLAGFSFTAVIAISADPGHFRWPGPAVLALTFASVLLIVAVQAAKRADEECLRASSPAATDKGRGKASHWYMGMRAAYHIGITALLLGLGFVLVPKQAATGQSKLLLTASVLAFIACLFESGFIIVGCWRLWIKRQTNPSARRRGEGNEDAAG